ncbi:FAD/NAD-P-binding domain-containing protein [Neolentinus lepideus HHB14362 ss-1]|uniref:Rab proteins geranylgeranyltransferase n=1 Tax=Neolentinus lepideus HHB14362 ss-1 TaxID=1314782 RepID=A0A165P7B5_9AGAM|nr:FAD/NAD-P-binding domain-containing protein [Neolentinus lepideus HHB14362 ss-1]
MSDSETHFDVIILGTGLTESIAAAALSKAGFKVAHLDQNAYYGGDEASLTLDELVQWADTRAADVDPEASAFAASQTAKFTSISHSHHVLPNSRQYSLSLTPSIIPSKGPLISSLIGSGVSRYGGYKLLERIAVFSSGEVRNVPGCKEDVFKSKDLSLVEKRRLMRFLMFASGEFEGKPELEGNESSPFSEFLRTKFSLKDDVVDAITYALAFCTFPSDPTVPALRRIRRYLLSSGRYGASPFLVGQYGGAGEIAQGFCRVSAVHGGVYILGRKILAVSASDSSDKSGFTVQLEDLEDKLTCDLLISSQDFVPPDLQSTTVPVLLSEQAGSDPPPGVARCIAIFDGPIIFPSSPSQQATTSSVDDKGTDEAETANSETQSKVDTAILVFPPGSLPEGSKTSAATVLLTGEGTMSGPAGKCIAYISLPVTNPDKSAEMLLKPYLHATLASVTESRSESEPHSLFSLFYLSTPPSIPSPQSFASSRVVVTCPPSNLLPESMDTATKNAETVFWEAVKALRPALSEGGQEDDTVESFWPPLEVQDEDEEGW